MKLLGLPVAESLLIGTMSGIVLGCLLVAIWNLLTKGLTMKIHEMTAAHKDLEETKRLADAVGIPPEVIPQAAASGIDLVTLLKLVNMWGLPIIAWLAQMFGWKLPVLPPFPIPPLPTPGLKQAP